MRKKFKKWKEKRGWYHHPKLYIRRYNPEDGWLYQLIVGPNADKLGYGYQTSEQAIQAGKDQAKKIGCNEPMVKEPTDLYQDIIAYDEWKKKHPKRARLQEYERGITKTACGRTAPPGKMFKQRAEKSESRQGFCSEQDGWVIYPDIPLYRCYYLVDENPPEDIVKLREHFAKKDKRERNERGHIRSVHAHCAHIPASS
jgi:hypothetical protein